MSMRDKIAGIVSEAECSDDRGYGPIVLDPDAIADAIIAALPEMIAPLVWDGFISGPYRIEVYAGGIANLWFHGKAIEDDEEHDLLDGGYLTLVSMDDLIAAANAHHRASIMEAFTGETT
jgi:hypothetical protein